MKCIKCGKYITSDQTFCTCGSIIIMCPKCNDIVSTDDDFCGNCGENLKETISNAKKLQKEKEKQEEEAREKELKEKRHKELEEEMQQFAFNIIIESEGNKFKAIKDFKDKFNVDNDIALDYINLAYDKINNNSQKSASE